MKLFLSGSTALADDNKSYNAYFSGQEMSKIPHLMIRLMLVLLILSAVFKSEAMPVSGKTGFIEVKDAMVPALDKTDEITYTLSTENKSPVVLTEILMEDQPSELSETIDRLFQREEKEDNKVIPLEMNEGSITITETTSYFSEGKTALTAIDTTAILVVKNPRLGVTLSPSSSSFSAAGEEIQFKIEVSNTGNVDISEISVTDLLAGVEETIDNLAPRNSLSFSKSYYTTQTDLDAGGISNTAFATGQDPENAVVTAEDTETVIAAMDPQLEVIKTASPVTFSSVGEEITYIITVENTGNVTLTDISVTDPLTGMSDIITALAPSTNEDFTESYTVTQADLSLGIIENTASASGTDPDNNVITDDATVTVNSAIVPVLAPGLNLTKSASPVTFSSVGDAITYTILVENTGDVTLTNILVTDPLTGMSENIATLAPGADEGFTEIYSVTQDDLNKGNIVNDATASGIDPENNPIGDDAAVTVTAVLNPALSLTKSASPVTYSSVGDIITYTITVENTGNVTITDISVTDPLTGMSENIASLDPGADEVFTETYTVTQADLNLGEIVNDATASGMDPENNPVAVNAAVTVTAALDPALSLTKSASPVTFSSVGDIITYTITVENTGNVTITDISVTDPLTGMSENIASLAPETDQGFTETYTVTQADLNLGEIVNDATASGMDPENNPVAVNAAVTVTAALNPALSLTKSASPVTFSSVGDVITYTITVENTGNITITDLSVTDPLTGMSENIASLDPGADEVFTETYTVTQADLDRGDIVNDASASGTDPGNNTVTDDATVTVNAALNPALGLTKTASPSTFSSVGDEIIYTIRIENTGNITISDITVSDPLTGMSEFIDNLAPGAEETFIETFIVSQADLDRGRITNTAIASGRDSESNLVDTKDSETVNAISNAQLTLTKSASAASFSSVGETITYTILVENTGNITITNLTVSDPLTGMNESIASLAPGSNAEFSEAYVVTQEDLNRGNILNTATVSGRDSGNNTITAQGSETVNALSDAQLNLTKTASANTFSSVGEVISYTIEVENTGNVTITDITVSDPLTGMDENIASLAPGENDEFTETYTVTQADLNTGTIINTATASGTDPEDNTVTDDATVTVNGTLNPGLTVTKSASPATFSTVGEIITYTIVVENTGNVTITDITVSDPLTGMNESIANLAPGTDADFTETYAITQADINTGRVTNTASASGTDPEDNTVTDDATVTVNATINPGLSLTKSASPATFSTLGELLTYTIVVENTGNVSLSNITVTDPITGMNENIETLDPGTSRNFIQTYPVSQSDINEGSITNTATASTGLISETASVTVTAVQNPQLTVSKSPSPATFAAVGDEITFVIVVQNTGNVTVSNIAVTDPMTGMNETIVSLAPGISRSFTQTYVVSQPDLDAGTISNTVTASNNIVSASATATLTAPRNPDLRVSKDASPENYTAVGDEIVYTIIVSNTGNVTITGIMVEDPLTGMNESIASLAPGASRSYTETYLVTASGLNAGKITNTVSVSGLAPDNSTVSASDIAEVTALGPPVANDDISADHTSGDIAVINILANDLLHNGLQALPGLVTVDINLQTAGIQNELVVAGEGVWRYNPSTGDLSFTPDPGFTTDPDPITYLLTEILTGLNDEATVTVDYNEGEPFAINDSSSGNQPGSTVTIDILSNDRLSDGSQATPGLVTIDLDLQVAGIQTEFIRTGEGTWSYNPSNGQVTFVPQAGYTTDPTPLIYNLIENLTELDDQATITIGYNEEPPVAADDSSSGNNPGDVVSINILDNDRLSDGTDVIPDLVQVDLNDAVSGIQNEILIQGQGMWAYNTLTGILVFIPEAGFTVDPDPIPYRLIEIYTGLGSNATVTIQYNRQPPVANDDVSNGNNSGEIVAISILSNDRLSDDSEALPALVTVDIDNSVQGIQTELDIQGVGIWNYNAVNGILTFTPETGFSSSPSPIAYTLTENHTGLSAEAQVFVNYNPEAPAAFDDTSTGNQQGDTVYISILANDMMSDGSVATPGKVIVDLDQVVDGIQVQLFVEGEGTWLYNAETGILTFIPIAGFTGDPASLIYSLCSADDTSLCSEASVYVYYEQTIPEPALALVKTGLFNSENESVLYTFHVFNTGNTEIEDISVSDERIGISALEILPATLAPGDSGIATFIYMPAADDWNAGIITNSASVIGFTSEGNRVEDISGTDVNNDEPTITSLNRQASVLVEKETVFLVTEAILNEVIDFRIIVTNNGNVVLTEVLVTDPLTDFEHEEEQILPGESYTYTTSYTVQAEDEKNGEFENSAYAAGKAPDGSIVADSSSVIIQVEGCELVIPTGFSPNDDGIQDYWRIQCLEKYPDARIEIFNRWGSRVFEMERFGNVDVHGSTDAWWDGYSSSKATFGSGKLPAGTYYYMLDLGDGSKPFSGFIFLNR
jgi:gliding motility-associated-like protein/uncharacterized repeat protein (TIGR01451 family)